MAGKKSKPILQTSVRAKKLRASDSVTANTVSKTILPKPATIELMPNNIGNIQSKPRTKANNLVTREKTAICKNALVETQAQTLKKNQFDQKKELSFLVQQKPSTKETAIRLAVPSTVISKTNEVNTISDLSTLPSQFQSNEVINRVLLQEKAYQDNKSTINQIDTYVKTILFRDLKFISDPEMMLYKTDTRSLSYVACTYFKVQREDCSRFWSLYSKWIPKKLNKKRSDVSNSLKKLFKGKFIFSIYFYVILLTLCKNSLRWIIKQIPALPPFSFQRILLLQEDKTVTCTLILQRTLLLL